MGGGSTGGMWGAPVVCGGLRQDERAQACLGSIDGMGEHR